MICKYGESQCGEQKSYESLMLPPKRRIWNAEQKMRCGFSIDFSMARGPNCVLTPLKSASFEIWISSFVHPSKIVVWAHKTSITSIRATGNHLGSKTRHNAMKMDIGVDRVV
jgi:hypothetical protein